MKEENKILAKLKEHDKRFEQIDEKLEKIILKLLEHDDKFVKIDEKFQTHEKETTNKLDQIITTYDQLDIERISMNQAIDRMDLKLSTHDQSLSNIKKKLKTV